MREVYYGAQHLCLAAAKCPPCVVTAADSAVKEGGAEGWKEAASGMFSCCKTLPSRYSRYLRAQTKPSKHVSSRLSTAWSHTTEKSCDKATRHFSNYSKYRICWNPEVAYPAISVLWRDMLWLVRTDKKRSRRLWGALNQEEAGSPPCRKASKVLQSVIPPLPFLAVTPQFHFILYK